jgi:hypothetical protein
VIQIDACDCRTSVLAGGRKIEWRRCRAATSAASIQHDAMWSPLMAAAPAGTSHERPRMPSWLRLLAGLRHGFSMASSHGPEGLVPLMVATVRMMLLV